VLQDNTGSFPPDLLEAAQKLHDEAFLVRPQNSQWKFTLLVLALAGGKGRPPPGGGEGGRGGGCSAICTCYQREAHDASPWPLPHKYQQGKGSATPLVILGCPIPGTERMALFTSQAVPHLPAVQEAVAKLCLSWWQAGAAGRESLVLQALPFTLVKALTSGGRGHGCVWRVTTKSLVLQTLPSTFANCAVRLTTEAVGKRGGTRCPATPTNF